MTDPTRYGSLVRSMKESWPATRPASSPAADLMRSAQDLADKRQHRPVAEEVLTRTNQALLFAPASSTTCAHLDSVGSNAVGGQLKADRCSKKSAI